MKKLNSLLYTIPILLLAMLQAGPLLAQDAQYAEESATLESVLESRARNVLNTLLRPNEYTITVSVQIKDDPEAVADYQKDVELKYLPGFPIPTDPELMPANNKLHSLRQKVTVHLILEPTVEPEKEKLLKDVIKAKLHLDETVGDVVQVSRSDVNPGQDPKPEQLPELSWKMWALVILMTLLAIAALIYYWNKKQSRLLETKGAAEGNQAQTFQQLPTEHTSKSEKDGAEGEGDGTGQEDHHPLDKSFEIDQLAEMNARIARYQQEIYNIGAAYPHLASQVIEEIVRSDDAEKIEYVSLAYESLGWGVARKLLPAMTSHAWGKIGMYVRRRTEDPVPEMIERSVRIVYKHLIAKVIELASDKDEANPFAFVFALEPSERIRLLKGESPTNLALISVFATGNQLAEILGRIPSEKQNDVIIEIARLKNLPDAAISASVRNLKSRLDIIRTSPDFDAEGAKIAANLLRSMPPEREQELFDLMAANNPDEAEKIRRLRVQFTDLSVYPEDLLVAALDTFDADVIMPALFEAPAEVSGKLLGLLPPKKARMVEGDLQRPGLNLSRAQVASARRQIVNQIETLLTERRMTVKDIWAMVDGVDSGGSLVSAA